MQERVLHILFDGPDELASEMISAHSEPGSGLDVRVIDMSTGEVSHGELVDEIFRAGKVFSWHR